MAWYLVQSVESEQTVYRLHHEELVRYFKGLTQETPAPEIQERIAFHFFLWPAQAVAPGAGTWFKQFTVANYIFLMIQEIGEMR